MCALYRVSRNCCSHSLVLNRAELEPKDKVSSWHLALMGCDWENRLICNPKRRARSLGRATLGFDSSPSSGKPRRCRPRPGRGNIASASSADECVCVFYLLFFYLKGSVGCAPNLITHLECWRCCWYAAEKLCRLIIKSITKREVLHAASGKWHVRSGLCSRGACGTDHGSGIPLSLVSQSSGCGGGPPYGLWNSYEKRAHKNRCYPGGEEPVRALSGLIVIIVRGWGRWMLDTGCWMLDGC